MNNYNDFYKGKRILVAGSSGLVGVPLVNKLVELGGKVVGASLDEESFASPDAEHVKADLTEYDDCLKVCKGVDYVFMCAGNKSSPKICLTRPVAFMESMTLFNFNMLRAAAKCNVAKYLFTSSIAVYRPAPILVEDDVNTTYLDGYDKFAGGSKRISEVLCEAYQKEFGWDGITIVRPTSMYGKFDRFDKHSGMATAALITRIEDGENPLKVWGSGRQKRDLLYNDDCVDGMLHMLERGAKLPVNLATGEGVSIRDLVSAILKYTKNKPEVIYDEGEPTGDEIRIMSIDRAKSYGWEPKTSLDEGIKKTIDWYKENKHLTNKRYNVFK